MSHLDLQAKFKLTLLGVPPELLALSDMPVAEEKLNGQPKAVSYQESSVMPTYQVAIVIGLFDYDEYHTPDGKSFLNSVSGCFYLYLHFLLWLNYHQEESDSNLESCSFIYFLSSLVIIP